MSAWQVRISRDSTCFGQIYFAIYTCLNCASALLYNTYLDYQTWSVYEVLPCAGSCGHTSCTCCKPLFLRRCGKPACWPAPSVTRTQSSVRIRSHSALSCGGRNSLRRGGTRISIWGSPTSDPTPGATDWYSSGSACLPSADGRPDQPGNHWRGPHQRPHVSGGGRGADSRGLPALLLVHWAWGSYPPTTSGQMFVHLPIRGRHVIGGWTRIPLTTTTTKVA